MVTSDGPVNRVGKALTARDRKGTLRYFRNESIVSGWEIKQDLPGRLKLKNPVLYRKAELCQAIERELISVLGVDKYKTSSLTSTVVIDYDPRELSRNQVIEIIESALENAEHPTQLDKLDLHLPICTASLPAGGDRPVRLSTAAPRRRGGLRLHVDPDLQGSPARPVPGEAARG